VTTFTPGDDESNKYLYKCKLISSSNSALWHITWLLFWAISVRCVIIVFLHHHTAFVVNVLDVNKLTINVN